MTDPARTLDAPTILIDHQEKRPWSPFVIIKGLSWILPTERAHLGTGDYAVKGLERFMRIERKAEDLYSTLFSRGDNTALGEASYNQDRFRRELFRFKDPAVVCPDAIVGVWIEGSIADLFGRTGVHHGAFHGKEPWELWNLLCSIEVDYSIPVTFVGGPRSAGLMLGTIARRMWEQATDPKAVKKAEKRMIAELLPWCGALIPRVDQEVTPCP